MKLEELNKLYNDCEEVDKESFAEMRSNVLLVAGEHFSNRRFKFFSRIRNYRQYDDEKKVRLSKNHVQKISKTYVNNIASHVPGIAITPFNPDEMQDQKNAELHGSVWNEYAARVNFPEWLQERAQEYVDIGEVASLLYWNPYAGPVIGYEAQPDSEEADMAKPVFAGQLEDEPIYGFNLLRDRNAKSLSSSRVLIVRKMVLVDDLKREYPDKEQFIKPDQDKTFRVFDPDKGSYRSQEDNEVMLKSFYFRPCAKYPRGYYYQATELGKLDEGELVQTADGRSLFPIVAKEFDKYPTAARGKSFIKQIRPLQAEINRCTSKIAEHQMTLGDDKLIIWNGSKISSGGQLPGVRAIKVNGGQKPDVLQGRSGEQYFAYMEQTINEMYRMAMADDDNKSPSDGNELLASLYRSEKKKMYFKHYVEKFSAYVKEFVMLYLDMSKVYLTDEHIINMIGKTERINIQEYKRTDNLGFQVKIEEKGADADTMFGRYVSFQNILQYVGKDLDKDTVAKIIRNMPFANGEEIVSDVTIDYDNAKNLMLALERGEQPEINQADDAAYMAKALNHRMRKSDFRFLHDFVKMNYEQYKQQYIQLAEKAREREVMENQGMIPMTGPAVGVDFYVQYDPSDPTKTRRARIPHDAIQWLVKRMESQGATQTRLEDLPQGGMDGSRPDTGPGAGSAGGYDGAGQFGAVGGGGPVSAAGSGSPGGYSA